jgi:hypothetical protein
VENSRDVRWFVGMSPTDLIFGDVFAVVRLHVVVFQIIILKLVKAHVNSGVAYLAIFIKYCMLKRGGLLYLEY